MRLFLLQLAITVAVAAIALPIVLSDDSGTRHSDVLLAMLIGAVGGALGRIALDRLAGRDGDGRR